MIKISTRQFEMTDSINEKIEKSFQKHLTLVKDDSKFEVHVERITNHHKHGEVYRIEVSVNSAGKIFHAQGVGEGIYELVDEVADKLHREIVSGGERCRDIDRGMSRKVKNIIKQIKFW